MKTLFYGALPPPAAPPSCYDDDPAALVGQTVADRFDVLALIGRGGMGAVYRARDRELDELVAFKVIRGDLCAQPEVVDRFRREVKLARRVTHPNVARLYELGHAGDLTFATMELIDGEPLSRRRGAGRLPVGEAVAIIAAVCDALSAAHAAGVIHRDIKPDNILIAADGRVVVADFGIAALSRTDREELGGTPAYMAPEQARGEPPTPSVDVYAAAVVLYELLAGERAFAGTVGEILLAKADVDHLDLGRDLAPVELARLIARATAADPGRRPPSAAALRVALSPWLTAGAALALGRARAATRGEFPSLVVLPPVTAAPGGRIDLAAAVHEELLALLGRRGGLRARPRAAPPAADSGDAVLELVATADVPPTLRATIRLAAGAPPRAMVEVPLELARIDAAAATIAHAVAVALDIDPALPPPRDDGPARELMLCAREAINDWSRPELALELYTRAAALAPDDPAIAAGLAMAEVRRVFFASTSSPELLESAAARAHAALAAAPDLADSHLAVGHVELHTGLATIAAHHFRAAIALAPHKAEAHLWMGRLLLEAGFLAPGIARLEEAGAIAPRVTVARWEIVRALALEGRWDEADALIEELRGTPEGRQQQSVAIRARLAAWRGRPDLVRALVAELEEGKAASQLISRKAAIALASAFLGGDWESQRLQIVGYARVPSPDRRRKCFLTQIAAESAGAAADRATSLMMLGEAVDLGLFDLHWLERCPFLAAIRGEPGYAPIHAEVKRRADAILDAFYGEEAAPAMAETTLQTSAPG